MAPQSAAASCRAAQRPGNREPGLAHEAGKATDTMYKIDVFTMTAVNGSLSAHEESTKHYDGASGCADAGAFVPVAAGTTAYSTPAATTTAGGARAPAFA